MMTMVLPLSAFCMTMFLFLLRVFKELNSSDERLFSYLQLPFFPFSVSKMLYIPKELRSHLVYKFSCSSCNATYYGKTECHLNVRSGEHIGLSPLTGNRVACKPSAISDHLLLHEHNNSRFNDFSFML